MQAGAIAAVLKGWHIVAAVLYVLSINHKHMLVYFAPAFFSYMLGCCLRKPPRQSAPTGLCTRDAPAQWRSLPQAAAAVAALGATVIAAMLVVWAPFLAHQGLALKVAPPHLWHSSFMHALLALIPSPDAAVQALPINLPVVELWHMGLCPCMQDARLNRCVPLAPARDSLVDSGLWRRGKRGYGRCCRCCSGSCLCTVASLRTTSRTSGARPTR